MDTLSVNVLIWTGIVLCISQSTMFSGLNLALLGISRLRLALEASTGNPAAVKISIGRDDGFFILDSS
jgi:CBS domain containing-hemolysin-like protein